MSDSITPNMLALECDTDPKTMRRFMRSLTTARASKGGRWEITSEDAAQIIAAFKSRKTSGNTRFTFDK